jgi:endonuclease/exonuclease/phosphatase family metal-dependent hydrolase
MIIKATNNSKTIIILSFMVILTAIFSGCFKTDKYNNDTFQVMTFNIRYDNPNDGENAWPNRKDIVASMIRFYGADMVGIQEALKNQVADLEERLPDYHWFGVGRDDGHEMGEYMAIFYRSDRFDLLDHNTYWLSETPDQKGKKGWDAVCARIVTWGQFKDKQTSKTFYLFNTHFDHRGVLAREKSAELLVSKTKIIAGKDPVIITGDFNSIESSKIYKIITSDDPDGINLTDARYTSFEEHHGPDNTISGFGNFPKEARIDFIFTNNAVKVYKHGILSQHWSNRYPSDHLPVLAEVSIY